MDTGLSPSIGTVLRQARSERALSFADVQQALRVSQKYLQALESDDYAGLPPGVYARALIRQYAVYLGLDPQDLLVRFGRIRPAERDTVRPALPSPERTRTIPLRAVVGVVVAIFCVGVFGYLQAQYNSFARSVEAGGGGVTAPALPTQTGRSVSALLTPFPTATSLPAPSITPIPTPVSGVVVEARTTERSWIQAWVDGASVLAEIVPSGSSKTFAARQGVRLRVGNAGGVEIVVNGVGQGPLGARGQATEATWSLN